MAKDKEKNNNRDLIINNYRYESQPHHHEPAQDLSTITYYQRK